MTKLLVSGVQADCEPIERHLPDGVTDARDVVRVVRDLVIGDEEVALVLVLQANPVFERASIVAEMK